MRCVGNPPCGAAGPARAGTCAVGRRLAAPITPDGRKRRAAACSGSICQTFAAVAKAMQSQPQLSAAQAYDQFGACFLQPWAQESDQACVHVLLEGLGHGSLALRKQAVDQAAQWLAQAQGQAREAQQRNGKLAITLGWTAGACLTLLLL